MDVIKINISERKFIKVCSKKVVWSIVKDEKNEVTANAKEILAKIIEYPINCDFILNEVVGKDVEDYCGYNASRKKEVLDKMDKKICKMLNREYKKHIPMVNILNLKSNKEFINENILFAIKMLAIVCFIDLIGLKSNTISLGILGYTIGSIAFDFKNTFIDSSNSFNARRKLKLYKSL